MIDVTIAMPCYQQAPFVEEAVVSVLTQQGVGVELIVQDPGSTDGSRELLERLRGSHPQQLVLAFEPDHGQSDAVNRALARARGRVFGWLNSDDRLRPGALQRVVAALPAGSPAWLYGDAGMIDAQGRAVSACIQRYKRWRGRRFSQWKLLTENFIPQMGVFWTRELWQLCGGLDPTKHLDMDYDLWLRFAAHCQPSVLEGELADFRVHGAAKGSRQTGAQLRAAWGTARAHARGVRGASALFVHAVLALRTRLYYLFSKPPMVSAGQGSLPSGAR